MVVGYNPTIILASFEMRLPRLDYNILFEREILIQPGSPGGAAPHFLEENFVFFFNMRYIRRVKNKKGKGKRFALPNYHL